MTGQWKLNTIVAHTDPWRLEVIVLEYVPDAKAHSLISNSSFTGSDEEIRTVTAALDSRGIAWGWQ